MKNIFRLFEFSVEEFLDGIYRILLGREIDEEGRRIYLSVLQEGWSYSYVVSEIVRSKEYIGRPPISGVYRFIKAYKSAQGRSLRGWFARNVLMAESDFVQERVRRKAARHAESVSYGSARESLGSEDFWRETVDDVFVRMRFLYYRILGRVVKESVARQNGSSDDIVGGKEYKIIQYWDSKEIPDDVREFMGCWEAQYGNRYVKFDGDSAEEFIRRNYPEEFALAYAQCWHPAMKSDFFRLCYIYQNGGCYVDADELPLKELPAIDLRSENILMLRPFIRINNGAEHVNLSISSYIERYDEYKNAEVYFANAPIIASPKNEIILFALRRAKDIILSARKYEMSLHDIAGPTGLSLSIVAYFLSYGFKGGRPVSVASIDWARFARSGSDRELAYKRDHRDWRKFMHHPGN
ncbi:glycosyltransferase [Burkholderia sp. FL-7-2-10-S1-D7]|uniref:glycosyltransferase n=1 Tax=Burkholderia sp. FL-7-2-10-S1-D7 TaxID=1637866 RepID=UPI0009E8D509|nr:glycosyltransferase [Burkholderia sp. FL-7-2-10-S1-D7]